MASTDFTFVNTTGAPSLNEGAAKRVRGHVTRTNFASKRERKAKGPSAKRSCRGPDQQSRMTKRQSEFTRSTNSLEPRSELEVAVSVSLAISRTDPDKAAALLNEFWSLMFVNESDEPGTRSNTTWLTLLASETALVEATMASALRCWSISAECRRRAEVHNLKALQMLTRRAGDLTACSDGFFGAAMTMAVSERFFDNIESWNIHIGGLAQAVRGRQNRRLASLPSMFMELLVIDSVNDVFDSARVYHPSIVDEMSNEDGELPRAVVATLNDVKRVARAHGRSPQRSVEPNDLQNDLAEIWKQAYADCQVFRGHHNPFLRATGLALEIILLLSTTLGAKDITWRVAEELEAELEALPGRSCFLMDLTSCQLILGAVAAKDGSRTQNSFVKRLRKAVQAMRLRGGEDPFAVLERTVRVDANITGRLRDLRLLIDSAV